MLQREGYKNQGICVKVRCRINWADGVLIHCASVNGTTGLVPVDG